MAKLQVQTKNPLFPVERSLYGLFFEDINRSGDSGLYPELLRNRTFEDSLIPEDLTPEGDHLVNENGWKFEFCHGEGQKKWADRHPHTDIPAWYAEGAVMTLQQTDTLNASRRASLSVTFEAGGELQNTGFCGIYIEKDCDYRLTIFARADAPVELLAGLKTDDGRVIADGQLALDKGDWQRLTLVLRGGQTADNARFFLSAPAGGSLTLGYTSLLPAKTYKDHGLRTDLCQRLEALKPGFLRFPGGCIVEGFSKSTIFTFKDSIGEPWERKSYLNLWGYRSTMGLGFHEYLQLCEDLGADGLYVFNCGMTCQARNCILLEKEEYDPLLQDALDAIEYALGDENSKWGRLRAEAGHRAPFPLKYIEIGNENNGPEYEKRYKYFYDAIHSRYPGLVVVANTHVEKAGLPLDIADEHFYDRAEWFAMNAHYYDGYDRKGPGIFVGEYATVSGDIRTQYTAVAEAMFLLGLERNQDIVKLASYAPLFENVDYTAWEPDLIAFDRHRSCAIPTYSVLKLFAENRGQQVLETTQESGLRYPPYLKGGPCVCASAGTQIRAMSWKSTGASETPVETFARELVGRAEEKDGLWTVALEDTPEARDQAKMFELEDRAMLIMTEDTTSTIGTARASMKIQKGRCGGLGMFCSPYGKPRGNAASPWNLFSVQPITWTIKDGESRLTSGIGFRRTDLCKTKSISLDDEHYHEMVMDTDGVSLACTLDGETIHRINLPCYETVQTAALGDGDCCIIKAANISENPELLKIRLDRPVESDYTLFELSGDKDAVNSLKEPDRLHVQEKSLTGAGQSFICTLAPCSVNVLRLKLK